MSVGKVNNIANSSIGKIFEKAPSSISSVGGGGGGGCTNYNTGNGGSGIVIIRYSI